MRDIASDFAPRVGIGPADHAATVNGAAVDLRGIKGAFWTVATGAITGAGAFSAGLQESDDNVTFTDVPAAFVTSTAPATLAAASVYELGYLGHRRWVRPRLVRASGTSIFASVTASVKPERLPAV